MTHPSLPPSLDSLSASYDQLDLLSAVLGECTRSLSIGSTLKNSTRLINSYLKTEGVSIFLLEEDGRELVCHACTSKADITGIRVNADQGVIGRALREGKPQVVSCAADDPDFYPGVDEHSGATTRSLACAPMHIRGESIGAIEVINKLTPDGLFDAHDAALLYVLSSATAFAIQNSRMAEQLVDKERMRHELELAREIQCGFFPAEDAEIPGIFGLNLPARTVSGDFYDYFQQPDGSCIFCIGDVAGKGINASLMVSHINTLFRFLRSHSTSPAEMLSEINNELLNCSSNGMFATMIAGVFYPHRDRVCLANAGHQPPLLVPVGGEEREFTTSCPPLGVIAELSPQEFEISLSGSCLYLFTDGLSESPEADGTSLNVEGIAELIKRHADLSLKHRLHSIIAAVTGGTNKANALHDDITLLALESQL